jgi:UDPglucose 6-dehydrogenase
MYKIGIVGRGFVGSAVEFGFSPQTGCDVDNLYIYDKDKSRSLHTLQDLVLYSDFIFLSVPTPSNEDGSINLSYVEDALQRISEITAEIEQEISPVPTDLDNIVLIRSTVTPGTTKSLQQKYQNLRLVFNPEFLTERSANFDFINQTRYILGGDEEYTNKVADLYRWRFGDSIPVIETNYQTAELIKYMNNCFFATKVSFLNEMKQVSDRCGADWDRAVEGFIRDGRIGHSHMKVPGPDGKFGFGGKCFPKDVSAMIDFGNKLGLDMHTLNGVWDTNCEVRPEKDWEDNDTGVAWVKKERKFTLEDVEMIQRAVRQHESDKE